MSESRFLYTKNACLNKAKLKVAFIFSFVYNVGFCPQRNCLNIVPLSSLYSRYRSYDKKTQGCVQWCVDLYHNQNELENIIKSKSSLETMALLMHAQLIYLNFT